MRAVHAEAGNAPSKGRKEHGYDLGVLRLRHNERIEHELIPTLGLAVASFQISLDLPRRTDTVFLDHSILFERFSILNADR